MNAIRPNIQNMAGYVPGEQLNASDIVKLNTNENPYPPSPRVFEAIRATLTGDRLRKYPQPLGDDFRKAAGRVLGVDPDSILIGNGSDDILTILTRAFADDEREAALVALSTYLMAEQGAPTMDAARAAAEDEITFAASLAQHPVQTLVAVHRTLTADGEISEQFRTFHAADAKQATAQPCSAGAFAVVEDGEDADADDHFDLAGAVARHDK